MVGEVDLEPGHARQRSGRRRISAGKSGSVERSLPSNAVSLVKRAPVSCIPSPESPAKRIVTWLMRSTVLAIPF